MNTNEVLKLALEALELHGEQYPHMVKGYCLDAITALREALASQGEALTSVPDWASEAIEQKSGIKQVIELYDSPDQPAQQKPVAAECKFDREQKWVRCEIAHHNLVQSEPHKWPEYQTRLLYTSPPAQRTWVGLTDKDYQELHLQMGPTYFYQDYGKAIEAKLKEKNT